MIIILASAIRPTISKSLKLEVLEIRNKFILPLTLIDRRLTTLRENIG